MIRIRIRKGEDTRGNCSNEIDEPELFVSSKENTSTGMLLRSIRKGMAYGWYTDALTFNVYFKDADNEISYKQHMNDTFEY